jgi:hypothetical protein
MHDYEFRERTRAKQARLFVPPGDVRINVRSGRIKHVPTAASPPPSYPSSPNPRDAHHHLQKYSDT